MHEIFADFGLPGRTIESITFTRHGRSDSARITFAADEACPALTRTMVIGLWRARTKYEVLRELVDTGFTHHHCGAIIARACAADFAARGLCF